MARTLDELTQYIRETLPQSKAILNLHPLGDAGTVSFGWHGREFVINPSLQTVEIKHDRLYITGASMLMQLALIKRNRGDKLLAVVVENLRESEEMISNPLNREKGLLLLGTVKAGLKQLVGR